MTRGSMAVAGIEAQRIDAGELGNGSSLRSSRCRYSFPRKALGAKNSFDFEGKQQRSSLLAKTPLFFVAKFAGKKIEAVRGRLGGRGVGAKRRSNVGPKSQTGEGPNQHGAGQGVSGFPGFLADVVTWVVSVSEGIEVDAKPTTRGRTPE